MEATTEESHAAIVPHTKEIFERITKPLRSAKKYYCLGDYAATIALCGTVTEMLAILVWKINDVRLRGNPITEQFVTTLTSRPNHETMRATRRYRDPAHTLQST